MSVYKSQFVAAQLDGELSRVEALRRAHIADFLADARRRLVAAWERAFYAQSQRDAFAPFYDESEASEELLAAHEAEIARLDSYYERNEALLGGLAKWVTTFRQFAELDVCVFVCFWCVRRHLG